jgi:hypothetical protein
MIKAPFGVVWTLVGARPRSRHGASPLPTSGRAGHRAFRVVGALGNADARAGSKTTSGARPAAGPCSSPISHLSASSAGRRRGRSDRSPGFPRQQGACASSLVCAHLREDADAIGRPELPPISLVARPAGPSVVGPSGPIGSEPWFPAEGGADVCWTRAIANCDEVGQRDLADRRPPLSQSGSRSRDAAAVAGGDTLAVDSCDTPVPPRWTNHDHVRIGRSSWCRVCGRSSGPRRTAAGVAQRSPRSRRPPRRCGNPAGEGPARTGCFSGLSRRPARPIELPVVATMRTGFEVGP